jgi:hypothetical protein
VSASRTARDPITRLKEIVADPRALPSIHDLLHAEAARVLEGMASPRYTPGDAYTDEELAARASGYEELTINLGKLLALGARWGSPESAPIWPEVIGRIATVERSEGVNVWLNLVRYPALLSLYAAGVAAMSGQRYDLLGTLLASRVVYEREEWKPAASAIYPQAVVDHGIAQRLPGLERRRTPLSDRLVEVLRPWLAQLVPLAARYERQFDRFEYLLGLVHFDLRRRELRGWGPMGRFSWRCEYGLGADAEVADELIGGGRHPLLDAGLFLGTRDRLKESVEGYAARIAAVRAGQY